MTSHAIDSQPATASIGRPSAVHSHKPPGLFARTVSGRRAKWLVLLGWVAMIALLGPLGGQITDVEENDAAAFLPESAQSTEVAALADRFPGADVLDAVVVYEREGGLTQADRDAVAQHATAVADLADADIAPPVESADGEALLLFIPILDSGDLVADVDAVADVVERGPPGLEIRVSGPAGGLVDFVRVFDGVDVTLFAGAALVVTVLLLLIYRSPVLWLLPVMSAALATVIATGVVYLLARYADVTVNGQTGGLLPVIVLAVGTDYALLLLARYREELHTHADRHDAMAVAVSRSGPAVVASAATVALAMLCLLAADLVSTQGLGPVAAVGVMCALLAIMTLLPALLVIFGRWIFWPKRPLAGTPMQETRTIWGWVGARTAKHPRMVWVGATAVLAAMTAGVLGMQTGLDQDEQFRTMPDSVLGQRIIAEHFTTGQAAPARVIATAEQADAVVTAISGVPGVATVLPPTLSIDGELAQLPVVLDHVPTSDEAGATVERLRDAVADIAGADALVGGEPATYFDTAEASARDQLIVIPMVLAAVLVVLALLLRSLVAPVLLVATVVLSFGAALGATWLLFSEVFGFAGVEHNHVLLGFVFLVALGVDYNIFLVHRAREETQRHGNGDYGHRAGMLRALALTGGVITSAGLVLAATFSIMTVTPLVTFTELGLLVAFGVCWTRSWCDRCWCRCWP